MRNHNNTKTELKISSKLNTGQNYFTRLLRDISGFYMELFYASSDGILDKTRFTALDHKTNSPICHSKHFQLPEAE